MSVDYITLTKRSAKVLEKHRLADEVGFRMMNQYIDHLERCESCRQHYGVGEFEEKEKEVEEEKC